MPESQDLVARASVRIDAPPEQVWDALVDPAAIEKYMFGAKVTTDWQEGSPIRWKGEWKGKPYEDKGEVLEIEPSRVLRYSHFSPLSKLPDEPGSYHTVTIELEPEPSADGARTRVSLTQDKNPNEEARRHSTENWNAMLRGLKEYVES